MYYSYFSIFWKYLFLILTGGWSYFLYSVIARSSRVCSISREGEILNTFEDEVWLVQVIQVINYSFQGFCGEGRLYRLLKGPDFSNRLLSMFRTQFDGLIAHRRNLFTIRKNLNSRSISPLHIIFYLWASREKHQYISLKQHFALFWGLLCLISLCLERMSIHTRFCFLLTIYKT